MPHKTMSSADVPAVDIYTTGVRQLLERAKEIKEEASIEPPLNAADFIDHIEFITKARDPVFPRDRYTSHAVVETALRNTFYELLV
jgi:THO complex subunit 1